MNAAELKSRLKSGGTAFGCMVTLVRNPRFATVFAGGGIDYVVIDTEHSSRDRGEVADLVWTLKAVGVVPIVRVASTIPYLVAVALDAGASGVLVPYCERVEDVRECVAVANWHPLKGENLKKAMAGTHVSDASREYLANRHKDGIVIIGIESEPAYRNLDRIMDVGGMDALFIGPNDMSTSLGTPDKFDQRYWDVCADIVKRAEVRGLPTMIHHQTPETAMKSIEVGARFVLYSSEGRLLQRQMQSDFTALRTAAGKRFGGATAGKVKDTIETV
jgi:4-hydroxy-2-oxoheptanedioate aldolase